LDTTNLTNYEKEPLVSCIINFYNVSEIFFQEAIESVLAQTYKNWELLLVDDGSTNGSNEIALEYAKNYPQKIYYLQHENHQNRGASATRNLGIKNASGEFIAFLDSDDIWFSHKLEQQVEIMQDNPLAAMVYGKSLFWHSWTGIEQDAQSDYIPKLGIETNQLYTPPQLVILCYPLGKANTPTPADILVRREAIIEIGGFEEDFKGVYQLYEDQVLFTKLFLRFPVFVANKLWDKYRLHQDSCCSNVIQAGKYESVRFYYLNWLGNYLNDQGINNYKIRQLYFKAIFPYRYPSLYKILKIFHSFLLSIKKYIKLVVRQRLPFSVQMKIKRWFMGRIRFGNLRRLTPIGKEFGRERGLPVDRLYIEEFLADNLQYVHGHVLEIGDATYTRRFGGERVKKSDVLHVVEGNPEATIVGDLSKADHIPSEYFDCIIITQTLNRIYDIRSALATLFRILKSGGVLLVTVPGISKVGDGSDWGDDWHWAFTDQSARLLFEEFFNKPNVEVETYGNVLTAIAFLHGIATEDLTREELVYKDKEYQVIITVKAVKI